METHECVLSTVSTDALVRKKWKIYPVFKGQDRFWTGYLYYNQVMLLIILRRDKTFARREYACQHHLWRSAVQWFQVFILQDARWVRFSWPGNPFHITGPLCVGKPSAIVGSPHTGPRMWNLDITFTVSLNKLSTDSHTVGDLRHRDARVKSL